MPHYQTDQWDMSFGVLMSLGPQRLVFSFIFNQAICLLHPMKPYCDINFPYQHILDICNFVIGMSFTIGSQSHQLNNKDLSGLVAMEYGDRTHLLTI